MIKISDYLDYLNKEIIQARKKADENAVGMAKEYSNHEYLKFFKTPRFTIPNIKIDIPLKVSDIDYQKKYDFTYIPEVFLEEVNKKIYTINQERDLKIRPIELKDIEDDQFKKIIRLVEEIDQKFTVDIEKELIKAQIQKPLVDFLSQKVYPDKQDESIQEYLIVEKVFTDVIKDQHKVILTKLEDIYIDPDTTKEMDKGKIFVNLQVEMVEEGIKIIRMKDSSGNEIEEITID